MPAEVQKLVRGVDARARQFLRGKNPVEKPRTIVFDRLQGMREITRKSQTGVRQQTINGPLWFG